MAHCLRCEKEIPDGMSFCENCKATINAGQNGQPAFAQQPPQAPAQPKYQQVPPQQNPYQQPNYQQAPYQQNPQQQPNYQQAAYQQSPYQQPNYQQAPYQQNPYQQPNYQQPYPAPAVADAPSTGFAILSFFFPLVGLVLWLVWKDKTPLKAKSCGKGALIGVIVNVVFSIIYGVIIGVATSSMMYY